MKPLFVYVTGLTAIFAAIWVMLGLILPETKGNLLNALSTAFGLEIPDTLFSEAITPLTLLVIVVVSVLSIALILIHVYFEATITARIINPHIDLYTSKKGVLSTSWSEDKEHILVRLVNFHPQDLLNVEVKAIITVHEKIALDNGETDEFICFFPVEEIDPENVLILGSRTPWSIAVPSDITLSNSIRSGYSLNLGAPIRESFLPQNKLISCKREIEFLITGVETKSSSHFALHRKVLLDEQNEDGSYTLHLHKGSFQSLPLQVSSKSDVEEYV